MENKELFKLIEKYGYAMQDLGYHNAASFLSNPKRVTALITSCKLIAKIERELGLIGGNDDMTDLLKKVEKNIEVCESYKKDLPVYYDAHWKMHHELLIEIRKELKNANSH